MSERQSTRLQFETLEERQERLQKLSKRQSTRLQSEAPEERQERLRKVSHSMKRWICIELHNQ